jgi:Spy/CpxP family protein refolding chaperone
MASPLVALLILAASPASAAQQPHGHHHSPYAGRQSREIKALSDEEIRAYLAGEGMGFAVAAELNHHPGPKHVLELAEPLRLTGSQRAAAQAAFEAMRAEAVRLGARLVEQERRLDAAFAGGTVTEDQLAALVHEAARIHGELRLAHLKAHLAMRRVLTGDQVARYDELRGYRDTR